MKLYLLTDLGEGGYDCYDGFVIAAPSEEVARKIANRQPGDEGKIWENKELTSCSLIAKSVEEGVMEGIILASFNAG